MDNVEFAEKHRKGGYHPVHIADKFKHGRYHVAHKLGYSSTCTLWLASDKILHRWVAMKILCAKATSEEKNNERQISRLLDRYAAKNPDSRRKHIISMLDEFTIKGPNSHHSCFIFDLAGPTLHDIDSGTEDGGHNRTLRPSLARKLAGQVANGIAFMHAAGVCHGGIC